MDHVQLASEVEMAGRLEGHLGRFDDALMKVQKERSKLVMANQEAASRLMQMAVSWCRGESLKFCQQAGHGQPGGRLAPPCRWQ